MELSKYSLDLILVPLSLCLTTGYHIFLWLRFKTKGSLIPTARKIRGTWATNIIEENKQKGILGVQSLRNSMMNSILSCSLAVISNAALAAQANNAYKASRHLQNSLFFPGSGPALALKFALTSLFLILSFLCSSMAVAFLSEGSVLINVPGDFSAEHVQAIVDRGFMLATAGHRVLYVSVPLLLWIFGPVPVVLSSVGLVWVLYWLDFAGHGIKGKSSNSCTVRGSTERIKLEAR